MLDKDDFNFQNLEGAINFVKGEPLAEDIEITSSLIPEYEGQVEDEDYHGD